MRKPQVRLKRGTRVRLTNGTTLGTVRLREEADGCHLYLIEWDNNSEPSFERRGHLIPVSVNNAN